MVYKSLEECLLFLEKNGQLVRITEEVDPNLEMAAIHLRVHELAGPALLFENVKGTSYRCASNIFGTLDRSKLIFGKNLDTVERLIKIKEDPFSVFASPLKNIPAAVSGKNALPKKNPSSKPVLFKEIKIC